MQRGFAFNFFKIGYGQRPSTPIHYSLFTITYYLD